MHYFLFLLFLNSGLPFKEPLICKINETTNNSEKICCKEKRNCK